MERGFAVIGLGYVGLPVALALARKCEPVIGFDISQRRITALREGDDITGEVTRTALRESRLRLTDNPDSLADASFLIVTVPTPIDAERRPEARTRGRPSHDGELMAQARFSRATSSRARNSLWMVAQSKEM